MQEEHIYFKSFKIDIKDLKNKIWYKKKEWKIISFVDNVDIVGIK